MAFIRKRGNIYYLVHNLREQGRVRQLYLARLGRRARINNEVIEEVMAKHPLVRVDWNLGLFSCVMLLIDLLTIL